MATLSSSRRLWILVGAALVCTGCDQSTKYVAESLLEGNPPISLLFDTLRLTYVENRGGFLSFGASLPEPARQLLFLVVVPLVLVGVAAYALTERQISPRGLWASGLVIGGGTSNFLDRLLDGGWVTDFLNIGIGWLRTGIFNVADMCVLLGALLLVLPQLGSSSTAANAQSR